MRSLTLRRFAVAPSSKSSDLAPRYADIAAPSRTLTTLRRARVQQRVSVLTLLFFLSAQWLMPGLWTLSEAQAAEAQQAAQKQASQKRAVDEAEARSKAPAPAWYRQARQKEQQNKRAMRLAQVPDVGKFVLEAVKAQPVPGSVAKKASGAAQAAPVRLARLMDGRPRAAKAGQITPSAPLYVPNPLTSTKRIAEVGERVPDQSEISQAGQMCGALAPAAPAQPTEFAAQLDKELRQAGLPAGLKTVAAPNTPSGILVAKQKERLKHAQEMNRDFARIINHWNDRNFKLAVKELRDYADQYPKSPWTPEALIHLADNAKFQGQPNEAKALYEQILAQTSAVPGQMSFEAHQKAYERLADLYIIQGRFSEARPLLRDIVQNDLHWRRRTWADHWLLHISTIRNSRLALLNLRDCGTKALAVVMEKTGRSSAATRVAEMIPSREAGFSLAELQSIASRNGVPMRGFKARAEQLASLPLPLVLHYGYDNSQSIASSKPVSAKKVTVAKTAAPPPVGHFMVVERVDAQRGMVYLTNPQDHGRYVLNYADLNREWTGTGLALAKNSQTTQSAKTAVKAVRWLSTQEMSEVFGACYSVSLPTGLGCNANNDSSGGGCSGGGCGSSGGNPGTQGGPPGIPMPSGPKPGTPQPSGGFGPLGLSAYGSPVISVNRVSQNIFVTDTPMWYHPAVGPPVEITVSYNSQDASNYNTCFGNKWSFNYGSHVVESSNGRVTAFMPDGRVDNYYPNGSNGYAADSGNFNTLVKTGTFTYELRFQGGDKAIYGIPVGTSGQQPFLLQLVDRWGYAITFGYDADIHLTSITDAQGKVTTLEWVSNPSYGSRVVRVSDPFERHTTFRYDDNGNMVECVDMEGNAFQYTYDAMVNLTQLNTAQGPWSFVYTAAFDSGLSADTSKRVTLYNPNQDRPEIYTYGGHQQYSHTDHRGYTTNFTVVQVGGSGSSSGGSTFGESRISSRTSPTGETTYYSYDTNTLAPSQVIEPNGSMAQIAYNTQGKPTTVSVGKSSGYGSGSSVPLHTTTMAYAPNGLDVSSITNALNQTVLTASFNAQHQPLSVTDAANHQSAFSYTAWGAPSTVTDATNHINSYNYDASSKRLMSISRDSSPIASFTYDVIGRVRTASDAGGMTLTYDYNNLDAVTRVSYPDGTYSSVDYVCCGLPGEMRDRSGRKTYTDYDALKRVARTQSAAGQVMAYDYDADSNLIRLQDAKSNLTRWVYDTSGRLQHKTYADGTYESYSYQNGQMTSQRDGRGRLTTYSYDDYGRLSLIDYPNDTDVSFSYDALDRPVSMSDSLGTTTFSYDTAGHLMDVDGPFANDTVHYSYDTLNRRSGMTINGGYGTNYGYDALSRLQSITSAAGTFNHSYVGNTQLLQSLVMPNGTQTSYSYDGLERLTQVQSTFTGSGANLSHYTYGYDTATFRAGRTGETSQVLNDPIQSIAYSYNSADEINGEAVSIGGTAQSNTSYAYDPMGNRAQVQATSATSTNTQSYVHNKLNQMLSLSNSSGGTSTLGYDAAGNLTNTNNGASNTNYTYDDANRLTAVEVPGNSKSTFLYDGASRLRVSKDFVWQNGSWVQQNEVRRIYDGMDVVQERDANNLPICTYTRRGNIGGILARTDTNGSLFYHYDGRRNVSQLSNNAAQVVARYSYDAFGNTDASGTAASLNRYRFSTKEQLAGLYSYGFRLYSPSLGRWINRDPIGERGGVNLYGFVKNGPTSKIDLYGLTCSSSGSRADDGSGVACLDLFNGCDEPGTDDGSGVACLDPFNGCDEPGTDDDSGCSGPSDCDSDFGFKGGRNCDAEFDECIDDCDFLYPKPGWQKRACLALCMAAYIECTRNN